MKKIYILFFIFFSIIFLNNTSFAGNYTINPISTSNISSYLSDKNLYFNEGFLNIDGVYPFVNNIYFRDYNGNILDTYDVSDFNTQYCFPLYKGFFCSNYGNNYLSYIDVINENNSFTLNIDGYAYSIINYFSEDKNKTHYLVYPFDGYINILNIKTNQIEYQLNPDFYDNWCNINNNGSSFEGVFAYYNNNLLYSCIDFMTWYDVKFYKISDKSEVVIPGAWGFNNYQQIMGINVSGDKVYFGTNLFVDSSAGQNGMLRNTPDGFYSGDFSTYYKRYSNTVAISQVLSSPGWFAYCEKPYFGAPTLSNGNYVCEAPDPPPLNPPPPPSGALNPSGAPYPIEPGTASGSVCANLNIVDNNNIFFTWQDNGTIPPTGNSPYIYGDTGYKICSYEIGVSIYNYYTNLKNLKCPLNDTIFVSAVNQGSGDLLPYYTLSCVYGLAPSSTPPTPPTDPTPPTPPTDPTNPTPPTDPTPPTPPTDPTNPTPPTDPTPPTPPEQPTEPESTSFIGSALNYIGDKLGNAFGFIGDMFGYVGDKIGNSVSWVGDKLGYIGDKLGNAFGFIGDMLGYIGDKLGNAFGFIGDMLGYIGDKLGNAFTYIGEVIADVFGGIGTAFGKIGDFFNYILSLFTSLTNAVNTFWDFLKSIMEIGQIGFIQNTYADSSPIADLLNSGTTEFLKGENEKVEVISDIVKTMKWGIFFIFIILILSIFFIVAYNQKK